MAADVSLFPVAVVALCRSGYSDLMAPLAGFVCVILAEICNLARRLVMAIFAFPEQVSVPFVRECHCSVFGRKYNDVPPPGEGGSAENQGKKQHDPVHEAVPFAGRDSYLSHRHLGETTTPTLWGAGHSLCGLPHVVFLQRKALLPRGRCGAPRPESVPPESLQSRCRAPGQMPGQ